MTSTIQSLCISIPETLLHVTLKRRAEISADIFARLLRYFFLSYKNLTITAHTSEILKLPVIYGTKYSKVRDFHDQLTRNYEALKAPKGETKVEGIVIETLDKLVHIKADLVRNDNNWEQWTFEKLVKALREWLKRHKPTV